jgi:two-component system, OmpR family, phosphate regulon sensor histidine kinase PhoR
MLWPWIIVAFAAAILVFVQWRWRKRWTAIRDDFRRELDRREAAHEEAALKLKNRQEAVFNSMTEGLVVLDEQRRIIMANRAFEGLFGISGDIRSRTMIEAVRHHALAELVQKINLESPVIEDEIRISVPTERWVQVSAALLTNDADRHHGAVLVFHDLTRLKKLELARKDFVANVSHELRTPLSLIKGYVETLLNGAKDDPAISVKFLRTIERNADRLKLLIEDLLTISELEAGRIELQLQPLNLQPLAAKVLEDLETRASARQITLNSRIASLQVEGDPSRVEQVLANLVDNAIKYGRPGGNVTLDARGSADGLIEVSVVDDGPGIPPDAIERIFERFYRADKARSREQGGTGLGLSIVKHIVQSHGGKVWAASEPGRGATFFFTLPRVVVAESKGNG